MRNPADSIHRLRISLDNVEPPIWRTIEIESDAPLDFLASSVQCAFGWSSTHACMFTIKGRQYGTHNNWVRFDPEQEYEERRRKIQRQKLSPTQRRDALNRLFDSWNWNSPPVDRDDTIPLLNELVRRTRAKFTFLFDFGDRWTHTVRTEKIEPALQGVMYPRCIDGAGADPAEDCGGPWSLMEVF